MTQARLTRDEAIGRVEQLLSSVSDHDPAPMMNILSSGVTWHSDMHETGQLRGAKAVQDTLGVYLEAFSDLTASPDFSRAALEGNTLTFEFTLHGTNDGELPGVGITNRKFRVVAAGLATFDDSGQITEVRTYWNCGVALAHLGIRAYARPGPQPA